MAIKKSIQTFTKLASVQTLPDWRSQIIGNNSMQCFFFGWIFHNYSTMDLYKMDVTNIKSTGPPHTHTPSASLSFARGRQCQPMKHTFGH